MGGSRICDIQYASALQGHTEVYYVFGDLLFRTRHQLHVF